MFVAGTACFAFDNVGLRGERGFMKLGMPMQFIHTNVPDFNEHIYDIVSAYFKELQPDKPKVRTNWGLAGDGIMN